MEYYIGKAPETSALSHYGILGMKWGVRRYQNKDGSLTPLGRRKLEGYREKSMSKAKKRSDWYENSAKDSKEYLKDIKKNKTASKRLQEEFELLDNDEKVRLAEKNGIDGWGMAEAMFRGGYVTQETIDRLAINAYAEERVDQLDEAYKHQIREAKRYIDKYENLKVMDLDSKMNTMSYKDIKRSIKNA